MIVVDCMMIEEGGMGRYKGVEWLVKGRLGIS